MGHTTAEDTQSLPPNHMVELGQEERMSTLLHLLGREMSGLAENLLVIQEGFGGADPSSPYAPQIMRNLQGLDLVEQTLRDLAMIHRETANALEGGRHPDLREIAGKCRLSAVAEKLLGRPLEIAAHGDLDLF